MMEHSYILRGGAKMSNTALLCSNIIMLLFLSFKGKLRGWALNCAQSQLYFNVANCNAMFPIHKIRLRVYVYASSNLHITENVLFTSAER